MFLRLTYSYTITLDDETHQPLAVKDREREHPNMEDTNFIDANTATADMNLRKRKVLVQTSLYTEDCLSYLQQALDETARTSGPANATGQPRPSKSRYASSSDEEDENDGGSDSGEGSDGSSSEEAGTAEARQGAATSSASATHVAVTKPTPRQEMKLEKLIKRQSDVQVRKHVDMLTCHNFQLREPAQSGLCLPTALLSKDDRVAEHPLHALKAYQQLSRDVQSGKTVVVFFVRSGRFAGAVFVRGECVHHRTTTRYTVRKGQGKAQSAQDSSRRPKSIGSQLRRQGEEKLREDITEAAMSWKASVDEATLVLVSCPKTMKKSFYDSLEGIVSREDSRVRRVPLDLGRPTFENAVLIHDVLTTVTVRELGSAEESEATRMQAESLWVTKENSPKLEDLGPIPQTSSNEIERIPLSALHVACKNGDIEVIRDVLASSSGELSVMAGPDLMTPLHYAASSSNVVEPVVAAECVTELLVHGHVDPTILDGRSRPAYFLASHERVRDAFRMARATLGEEYCAWDDAKVGPPLTHDDVQLRKEKEAEKRRKKKVRQKQKKAQEKAAAEELEQRKQEEEAKARRAEEAKRVRDGLQPKTSTATNVCDFCQTVCKGRKRSQMLKRLEYAYCSTECVQNHKRELMAKAAFSRFGS